MVAGLTLGRKRAGIFLSSRNSLDIVNIPLGGKKDVIQSTNKRLIVSYLGIVGVVRLTVATNSIRTMHWLGLWLPCHSVLLSGVCWIETRDDAGRQHLVVRRIWHQVEIASQDMRAGSHSSGKVLTVLGGKISMDVHYWRSVEGTWHVIVGQTKGLPISSFNSFLETDRYQNILPILTHMPWIDGILGRRWKAKQIPHGTHDGSDATLETALRKLAQTPLHSAYLARNALGLNARLSRPTLGTAITQPHLLSGNGFIGINGIRQCNAHVVVEGLSIQTSDHCVAIIREECVKWSSERMANLLQTKNDGLVHGLAVLHFFLQLGQNAGETIGKVQVFRFARREVIRRSQMRGEDVVADDADGEACFAGSCGGSGGRSHGRDGERFNRNKK